MKHLIKEAVTTKTLALMDLIVNLSGKVRRLLVSNNELIEQIDLFN